MTKEKELLRALMNGGSDLSRREKLEYKALLIEAIAEIGHRVKKGEVLASDLHFLATAEFFTKVDSYGLSRSKAKKFLALLEEEE